MSLFLPTIPEYLVCRGKPSLVENSISRRELERRTSTGCTINLQLGQRTSLSHRITQYSCFQLLPRCLCTWPPTRYDLVAAPLLPRSNNNITCFPPQFIFRLDFRNIDCVLINDFYNVNSQVFRKAMWTPSRASLSTCGIDVKTPGTGHRSRTQNWRVCGWLLSDSRPEVQRVADGSRGVPIESM